MRDLVFTKGLKVKSGYDAVEYFENSKKPYDAVVCASDELAVGVINALREGGKRFRKTLAL